MKHEHLYYYSFTTALAKSLWKAAVNILPTGYNWRLNDNLQLWWYQTGKFTPFEEKWVVGFRLNRKAEASYRLPWHRPQHKSPEWSQCSAARNKYQVFADTDSSRDWKLPVCKEAISLNDGLITGLDSLRHLIVLIFSESIWFYVLEFFLNKS
jgi:hypothetical protein